MKTLPFALALMLALPCVAQAQTAPTAATAPAYGSPISLQAAQNLIERGVELASARGFRLAFAVVEPSGELVAFGRMDDTQYGSLHVAQRKAATSARYRQATSVIESRTLAGRTVTLANEDSLPIAGGVPIVVEGKIVGALGVSGAASSEDDEIARAVLQP